MIVEHAAAVVALLVADSNLTVFDRPVPDLTVPPYVRPYISVDNEVSVSFADEQGQANFRITTHSVGASDAASWIVADRVRGCLHAVRPVVEGRSCWKIRHEFGIPPQPDESTGRLVLDVVDVWTFSSVPVPVPAIP